MPSSARELVYTLAFAIVRADEGVSGAERIYMAQLASQLALDKRGDGAAGKRGFGRGSTRPRKKLEAGAQRPRRNPSMRSRASSRTERSAP